MPPPGHRSLNGSPCRPSTFIAPADDAPPAAGGIGGGPGHGNHAIFSVGVPDVEAALQRAESLGGTRVLGPVTSPSGLVVGHFTDPEGNLMGVAGAD